MESRWYLRPGQTLQTTKIEDRSRALHITGNLWESITAHLDRNRLIQEAIEKEKVRKKFLKEGSQQMAENWEDSVVVSYNVIINDVLGIYFFLEQTQT